MAVAGYVSASESLMARRVKFPKPTSLQLASTQQPSRVDIVEPTAGFDRSQPAIDLQPGQTPDAINFVVEDGHLVPRSGLSQFASYNTLGDVGLLTIEQHSVDGGRYPVVTSGSTILYLNGTVWSEASYLGMATDPLSGTSNDIMFGASVYDPIPDENYLVISNLVNVPKLWEPGSATYSDHTDFLSVDSFGKIPYSIHDRLCFFNCASSQTTFATRVRWSERGLPSNMSTIGAGYTDLMDMRGVGSGVAVRGLDALLFSTEEIWVQRPLNSNFAFDFIPIERALGCPYPKTIAKTPQGIIFLTRELEPYIVRGSEVQSIGKPIHRYLRDNVVNVDRSFGLYNSNRQRYEFYYDAGSANRTANRGLYLDMDSGAWMPISLYDLDISTGAEVGADLASEIVWNDVEQTWDEIDTSWNLMVQSSSQDKNVMVVSSAGTIYRFRDEQGTDDGSTLTAEWASHALSSSEDPTHKNTLYELHVDYKAVSSGSFRIDQRGSTTDNYTAVTSKDYGSSVDGNRVLATPYVTGDHPQFKITVSDGNRPKFQRFTAKLRDGGTY